MTIGSKTINANILCSAKIKSYNIRKFQLNPKDLHQDLIKVMNQRSESKV